MSEPSAPPRRLNWKAVLTGFGLSLIVSQVVGAILIVAFSTAMTLRGATRIPGQLLASIYASTSFLLLLFVLTSFCTIGGAYLAAHLAPGEEIGHAVVVGVLTIFFNLIFLLLGKSAVPPWYQVAAFVLILPNTYFGGYLRSRRPRYLPAPFSASRPPIPEP